MQRRRFLRALLGATGAVATPIAAQALGERKTLIQRSAVAGLQYHDAKHVWGNLRVDDRLTLVREPHNRFDGQAVAVHWRDAKLGYLRRVDNTAVSQMLDQGEALRARIAELRDTDHAWEKIWVSVELV